ncbi:DUF1015 domain-containing protein [Anoxynatronum buryatiense]|uniref:Uncharacterized conserved protein, DUF1015 family n=1 Tax=Anoxynatronum buryatiense TaxID=489973 RepID=A0AA45WSL2_9CLOT|nr:DUF1015 family protein [Anoxynatronum buryatiense]SMP38497.1 Uncharacterized conserved protein, DUF1015 family [Anoxynatronum buryatiense]
MLIQPFPAIRPAAAIAREVSCLPYDVMNRAEALKMADGNPNSFLHVIRSEIDLDPMVDAYDRAVYQKASENLQYLIKKGTLIQDDQPAFYLYRQTMAGRSQLGIVACFSIDDYVNDRIKKHELTRPEKENDRIHHFDACDAHTEPVFLTHRSNASLTGFLQELTVKQAPAYDFITEDGIGHALWVVSGSSDVERIQTIFNEEVPSLYIADGHHRSASSAKIGLQRRAQQKDLDANDPSQFFMAVSFPQEDLLIMEYNRVVKDLNDLSPEELIIRLEAHFECQPVNEAYQPQEKHSFGMLIDEQWYALKAKPHTYDSEDVISQLDVSILQNWLLQPILGISDPRTDQRIDFVGGIRGIGELEKRVQTDMALAFSLFPTTIEDLLQVADEQKIMPPKSTWFEPKLRSGLFVHSLK